MTGGPGVIQVVGDSTVDWLVVAPPTPALRLPEVWSRVTTGVYGQSGGAALLADLLRASVADPSMVAGGVLNPEMLGDPRSRDVVRTVTLWQPTERVIGDDRIAWRMREFIGLDPLPDGRPPPANADPEEPPACLVIDDADLGFRDAETVWPRGLRDERRRPAQVVVKMTDPLASGALWDRLIAAPASLTVYCSLDDLRKEEARIGQALSWEQLSSEIVEAVRAHEQLGTAARVIVSCGPSGAVVVEPKHAWVLFDPANQFGDWEDLRPLDTLGLGTCVVAGIAVEAARPRPTRWREAVARGLTAARHLHEQGYDTTVRDGESALRFPIKDLAQILRPDREDGSADQPPVFEEREVSPDRSWTILGQTAERDFRAIARDIVRTGPEQACRGVPVERMGAWLSVDRREIESMRSVRNIIGEYLDRSARRRPLSIAVFGKPGSGKSFAIKQLARQWGGRGVQVLDDCNLAQFRGPDDLVGPFQELRDCAVRGEVPLVFWDEFDAPQSGKALGWLASFLAPMQDGQFLERGTWQPFGPSIFVFAGGTHATMEDFKRTARDADPATKATDFLSRLRGYVDILGPDQTAESDRAYILRRALLLRSVIERRGDQLVRSGAINIDPGVLRAFLEVASYEHGARSLEAIVDMSALEGKKRFERSSLPAENQLALHVDAAAFMELVRAEPTAMPS